MKWKSTAQNVFGCVLKLIPAFGLFQALAVKALPVNLGDAGDYAILETGAGAANASVSLAAAPPNGVINGNIGMGSSGNLSVSAGNLPINGSVYLATGATSSGLSGNVTGAVYQNYNLSAAISAAAAASLQAAGLASSGGGLSYSTINEANNMTLNLNPGVYNLADFKLQNGDVVNLAAGGSYVFNISGTLSLNSASILAAAGLSDANVLFNVTGSQGVAFSGGLNNECILDGILLADDASISLTPGEVNGEIIGGGNINIASGGSVSGGGSNVPDSGPTRPVEAACFLGILAAATIKTGSPKRKGAI
jgi:hypothetical protein